MVINVNSNFKFFQFKNLALSQYFNNLSNHYCFFLLFLKYNVHFYKRDFTHVHQYIQILKEYKLAINH